MKENELLMTHQVGDVINILQKTSHQLFDPDELLTVSHACLSPKTEFIYSGFIIFNINQHIFQVAFEKIGSMTTNTISKQRKKQEPAVMAELDQRLRRLNSLKESGKST